jgi:glycosyltransferase involved in cell wall biosynthesis
MQSQGDTENRVAALIPAFNEEKYIGSIIRGAITNSDLVIVCNDGSNDKTGEIAEKSGAIVVEHFTNKGYGASIQTLIQTAKLYNVDYAVTIDADGQHNPDDIPNLIEKLVETGCDIAIGSRFAEGDAQEIPWWRAMGVKLINRLTINGGLHVSDTQSGFRAYTKHALRSLVLIENGMGISTEILIKAGEKKLRICEVPIKVAYNGDTSTYGPLRHGLSVIFSTVKYLSINKRARVIRST